MAIDQNPMTSTPDASSAAAIDNEFPTYRAISPGAVLSLVLALSTVFCFASLKFLVVVAGSIVLGLLSLRKIRRLPDVLTGASFARAGIAVSLVFGLSAATHTVLTDFLLRREAGQFARIYAEVLRSDPPNQSLWYQERPDYRKTKNADEIAEELKKDKPQGMPDPFAEKLAVVAMIKSRLKGQGEEMRYAGIESTAVDGLTLYANALLEFDGPGTKDFPEKEQFALVKMVKAPRGGPHDWTVLDIAFPYKPASAVATVVKAPDDGHGHSH